MLDKTNFLLQSEEIERAVLGAALDSAEALHEVVFTVQKKDFYRIENQNLFEFYQRAVEAREPLDLLSLATSLLNPDRTLYNTKFLTQLFAEAPSREFLRYHLKRLSDYSVARLIAKATSKATRELTSNQEVNLVAILDTVSELHNVTVSAQEKRAKALSDASFKELLEEQQLALENKKPSPLLTGFDEIDEQTGGIPKRSYWVVGATSGVGKTIFTLNIAYNLLNQGKKVAFLSNDMDSKKILCRLASLNSKVPLPNILSQKDPKANIQAFLDLQEKLGDKLQIFDEIDSLDKLKSTITRLILTEEPDLIVYDYIQNIDSSDSKPESQYQNISLCSKYLSSVSKIYKVPVVVVAQLNRQAENLKEGEKPHVSQIFGSAQMQKDADVVILLHRDKFSTMSSVAPVSYQIAKNRNGSYFESELIFNATFSEFRNRKIN